MASKKSSSAKKASSRSSTSKSSSSHKAGNSSYISTTKLAKTAVKAAKKNPVAAIVIVGILLLLAVGGFFGYRFYKSMNPDMSFSLNGSEAYSIALHSEYQEKGAKALYGGVDISSEITVSYFKGSEKEKVSGITTESEETFYVTYAISHEKLSKTLQRVVSVVETDPISISFLELGNKFTGDSVYIKAGDTDILIDAGSRGNSASAIKDYLNQPGRVEDGKLEYVVATHAHQDHIAGFVGTSEISGIFASYECGTIIDFAQTGQTYTKGGTNIYSKYVDARDAEVASGALHYTAEDCVKEQNGAKKIYDVAPGITMEVLDQKFYHEVSSDENDHSVCLLFTQGENHYLFTGDLEKNGEASLVSLNPSLPEVTLFKGAHHGSYTANTDTLLSKIKPGVVCICCCAGSTEYTTNVNNTFPAQTAINNLGKYTEKIYVTTVARDADPGYESMNGTILCVSSKGNGLSDFSVHGSNNDTILKETAWFKANRTWPTA